VTAQANTSLAIKDRPAVGQAHCQRDQRHKRREHDQGSCGDDDVQESLDRSADARDRLMRFVARSCGVSARPAAARR
jgi:hypothetical protein